MQGVIPAHPSVLVLRLETERSVDGETSGGLADFVGSSRQVPTRVEGGNEGSAPAVPAALATTYAVTLDGTGSTMVENGSP